MIDFCVALCVYMLRWKRNLRLGVVKGEADLERYLVVGDFAAFDVTTSFGYLEPAHVLDALVGAVDRVVNGFLNRIGGRTYDFDFFIDVIAHKLQ